MTDGLGCEQKTCETPGGCGCAAKKMEKKLTAPPTGKDMLRMISSLTAVAMISAVILGALYLFTEPIRLKNRADYEAKTLRSLLNLSETAKIGEVRRYQAADLSVLYLTPKYLLHLDQDGKEVDRKTAETDLETADAWVKAQFPALKTEPVGRFFVAYEGDKILGYIVEGTTQGYKSVIRFFAALSADFQVEGVEVLEQEEDPGLGAEIAQKYFKNQLAGRSPQELEGLVVSKDPLDPEWKKALEELGATPFSVWSEKHAAQLKQHGVVHAITGATISSDALTRGVKRAVGHFQKRLELIKGAL